MSIDESFAHKCSQDDIVGSLCLAMLVYRLDENRLDENELDKEPQSWHDCFVYPDGNKLENDEDERALAILQLQSPDLLLSYYLSDHVTDLQAVILTDAVQKRVYVVFRGSESPMDWYYDVLVRKVAISANKSPCESHELAISAVANRDTSNSNVLVHRGFYKQLFDNSAFIILLNKLNTLFATDDHKDSKLFLTGHSLGAGLCTLFAYLIADCFADKQITVISFASPRVGNIDWKNAFNSKENVMHCRVTTAKDIVTVMPMWRYHHCGTTQLRLFPDTTDTIEPPQEYSLLNCYSIDEHKCTCYFNRLLQNM